MRDEEVQRVIFLVVVCLLLSKPLLEKLQPLFCVFLVILQITAMKIFRGDENTEEHLKQIRLR